jgi:hypothetical protein
MKKIYAFMIALLLMNGAMAQCFFLNPNDDRRYHAVYFTGWLWAKSAGGTAAEAGNSVATDASGNAYVTGWFNSPTLTFGSHTLTNSGSGLPDIFLAKYDTSGNVLWAKSAEGINEDIGYSVAVDASGNAYVSGYFISPTLTFGSDTLTNSGGDAIFLAKYDASGNVLWAKSAGGTGGEVGYSYSVAVDASGNAYLTGYFYSFTITFGYNTLTNAGYDDIFLVKYDAGGNVLWAKSAGGTGYESGNSVAVDASGSAYVTGYYSSPSVIFGSDTLTNPGNGDIFLAKYDAGGNILWAKSAGGTGGGGGNSVAVDASGNAYVTGYYSSPAIIFGSDTLTNVGDYDIFLAKYDAGGNVLWAKCAGGFINESGSSVTLDASGNAYVTGWFNSQTLTFGSDTLTNVDNGDIFLAKYDAGGNVLWAKSAGGNNVDIGQSAAMDASGNAYVTGWFNSQTLTFGLDTLTNTGAADIFLAKIKSSSNLGFNEPTNTFGLSIYPNPAADKISIQTSGTAYNSNLSIRNLNGQQLMQQEITDPTTTIDVSTLPSGIYLVKVIGENGVQVGKFVKQ